MARIPETASLLVLLRETASELRLGARVAGVVASCTISPAALFWGWLPGIGGPPGAARRPAGVAGRRDASRGAAGFCSSG
jgi:hypothetical protein